MSAASEPAPAFPPPLGLPRHLLVLLFFFVLTLVMTYPLATAPHRMLLGSPGDSLFFLWNLWWTRFSIFERHALPFTGDPMCRPFQVPLMHHTHTYFYGFVYCLGSLAWRNPVFWLNVCVLGSFTLAGYGMFLLSRHLCGDSLGAALSGIAYAFCGYRMMRLLGHVNLLSNEGVPFHLYFLLRGARERRAAPFLAAGAVAAATLWNDYYNAFFIALATAVFACAWVAGAIREWPRGRAGALRTLRAAAAGAVLFLALAAPFLLGLWRTVRGMDLVVYEGAEEFGASPLAYLTPSGYHRLLGPWLLPIYEHYFRGNFVEACVFAGFGSLALAIYGLARPARRAPAQWLFLAMGLLFFVLSLGATLDLSWLRAGWRLPLPYRWILATPLLADFRIPSRMGLMAILSCAALAGSGFAELARRLGGRGAARAAFAALAIFMLAENLHSPWPFHYDALDPQTIPFALCRAISQDPGRGAVLSVPFEGQDFRGAWMQVFHGKPTVTGAHARLGTDRLNYYARLDLRGWFQPDGAGNPWTREAVLRACNFFGLNYLLLPAWGGREFRPERLRKDWLPLRGELAEGGAWLGLLEPQPLSFPIRIDGGSIADNFYFLENFEPPEAGSRWCRGRSSTIVFKLDAPEALRLSILLGYPAHIERGRQSMRALLNGEPLFEHEWRKDWETHECALPKERLRAGYNYLKLVPALAPSPREMGKGEDDRPLALLVGPVEIRREP